MRINREFSQRLSGRIQRNYTLYQSRKKHANSYSGCIVCIRFSFFFEFSITGYAVLFTVFGLIMALEIVNTGLEALADQISPGYSPVVKVVKDIAAGAVLIMAIFAVAVAVVLFWQPEGFIRMYEYFCITMPIMWLPFVVVSALCLWYIVKGPIGMKNFFLKHKKFEEE